MACSNIFIKKIRYKKKQSSSTPVTMNPFAIPHIKLCMKRMKYIEVENGGSEDSKDASKESPNDVQTEEESLQPKLPQDLGAQQKSLYSQQFLTGQKYQH